MNHIFLAMTTMIVTHFLMKVQRKLTEIPSKDELERRLHYYEQQWRKQRDAQITPRFKSTPRSADSWMANIGTVGEMAKLYKENIPSPKEPCDHAALRPVMGRV